MKDFITSALTVTVLVLLSLLLRCDLSLTLLIYIALKVGYIKQEKDEK